MSAAQLVHPGGTPASAAADKIFNDPDSWSMEMGGSDEGDDGQAEVDVHLENKDDDEEEEEEENQEVPEVIISSASPPATKNSRRRRPAEFILKPFTSKHKLRPKSDLVPSTAKLDTASLKWESVKEGDGSSPIMTILEPTGKDLTMDLTRMSILWTHGNIFRALPSPLAYTPTESSTTNRFHSVSPLNVASKLALQSPAIPSPITIRSASTTWSILEWYGISLPETPRTPRVPLSAGIPPPVPPKSHLSNLLKVPTAPQKQPAMVPSQSYEQSILEVPNVPSTPTKPARGRKARRLEVPRPPKGPAPKPPESPDEQATAASLARSEGTALSGATMPPSRVVHPRKSPPRPLPELPQPPMLAQPHTRARAASLPRSLRRPLALALSTPTPPPSSFKPALKRVTDNNTKRTRVPTPRPEQPGAGTW